MLIPSESLTFYGHIAFGVNWRMFTPPQSKAKKLDAKASANAIAKAEKASTAAENKFYKTAVGKECSRLAAWGSAPSCKPGMYGFLPKTFVPKKFKLTKGAADAIAPEVDSGKKGRFKGRTKSPSVKRKASSNIIAAANVFAALDAPPDVVRVFITELPSEKFSIIVIQNGLPVSGMDVIVPLNAVEDRIKAMLGGINSDNGSNFEFYSNSDKTLLETEGLPAAQLFDFSELVEQDQKLEFVIAPTKIPPALLIGVVVAAGLGFYGFQVYQKKEAAKRAAAAQQQIDPNQLYAESLAVELPKVKPIDKERVGAILARIKMIPFYAHGWRIDGKVLCDLSANSCEVGYNRDGGTYKTFEPIKAFFKATKQDATGGRITATVDLGEAPKTTLDKTSLPLDADILESGWSNIQTAKNFGMDGKLTPSNPFALPPGVDAGAINKLIKVGNWSYSGELNALLSFIPVAPNLTLNKLALEISADSTRLSVEGSYYTRAK
jgi:hypothetical protein